VTTLEEAAALARNERGLVIVATSRRDATIQSSLVNAGIVPHPATGGPALAFVTSGPVKLPSLRARPQVTAAFRNGWRWATVEGHAEPPCSSALTESTPAMSADAKMFRGWPAEALEFCEGLEAGNSKA
jgi:hypothetical protein